MTAFFNLGSILFGLIAWGIPVIRTVLHKKDAYCGLSLTCCCIALLFQLCEIKHRVDIGDISAVMDTIQSILIASIVLVIGTIVLNVIVTKIPKCN